MDAIQVDNPSVFLQAALTPGFKLLGQRLVEATDGTGTGGDSHQGLSDFSHLVRAHPSHEHLRESFSDVWLVTARARKGLGMELTFTISGHVNLLQSTRRCREITSVGTVAIALRLGLHAPHAAPMKASNPRA
jgi:hypothetical protein